jgi:hypothetical protein
MRALDADAAVEKTTLFGTAVHAVLRRGHSDAGALVARLRSAGLDVSGVEPVEPSLEDVFLDVGGEDPGGMRTTLAVARKELRQIRRDRRTLLILLFVPVFFLLLFGYALNFDIRDVRLAVEDRDGTPESRRLVAAFVNSGYFELVTTVAAPARSAASWTATHRRRAGDPARPRARRACRAHGAHPGAHQR